MLLPLLQAGFWNYFLPDPFDTLHANKTYVPALLAGNLSGIPPQPMAWFSWSLIVACWEAFVNS